MSYFKCFSINLLRFLKIHGLKPISKGIHPHTNRTYWVFEVTDEVSDILTAWTKSKGNKQVKEDKTMDWKVTQQR